MAAPGDVLVIGLVEVRTGVPLSTPVVAATLVLGEPEAVATTGGVSVGVGAIVSCGGVGVGGASGGATSHDFKGSIVPLLTT